jgi:Icc-related predicted phosphoesterase
MRYLIIADMHGNWDALSTVLEKADGAGYDEALVLGDLVGYGASPNEIIEGLSQLSRPRFRPATDQRRHARRRR